MVVDSPRTVRNKKNRIPISEYVMENVDGSVHELVTESRSKERQEALDALRKQEKTFPSMARQLLLINPSGSREFRDEFIVRVGNIDN